MGVVHEAVVGPEIAEPSRTRLLVVAGAAVVTVVAGFFLIRPDWFHIQNGLDPFFYTGLALNLDDFIRQGGDAHYFISRWTLYLPELVFTQLLGDSVGFVAMRLGLLTLVAGAIVSLRERTDRWIDPIVVAVAVAFSPLVLRAVFVDYSDAIVVPLGIACVVGCVQSKVRLRSAALLGVAGAIAVIANPFAIFMVTFPLVAYLWRARGRRWVSFASMGAGAAAVALLGLAFFRLTYGIENVYAPTFRFIVANVGFADPLKSPSLAWLGYRLWIYLPALILISAWALSAVGLVRWTQRDRVVFVICGLQYSFQVLYQFIMDGSTLEIHYYFSYMIPAYSTALAVVLYAVLRRCSTRDVALVGGLVAVVLIGYSWLPTTRVRSWIEVLVILALLAFVVYRYGGRHPVFVPIALIVLVLGIQTRFPTGEPRLPNEHRVDAGYDSVYARGPSFGVAAFEQAAAFVDTMDQVGNSVESETGFLLCGGLSHQFGATYAAHVASPSHWLNPPGPEGDELWQFAAARSAEQGLTHIAILCDSEQLDEVVIGLAGAGLVMDEALLDYTISGPGDPTRILVASVQ
jgi:hypothetical protein